MKRFKFKLESVLSLRHFHKMEAAGKLAQASRSRQQASDSFTEGTDQLRTIEDGIRSTILQGSKAGDIQRIQSALLQQREVVLELKQAYLESMEKESKARESVMKAQREYKALVNLETRQRERARKEADKEDEKVMQEFVSAHHVLVKGG